MKVLYDHQAFSNQQFGGISRYFYELISRFDDTENICNVGACLSNNDYYNSSINPNLSSFFPESHFRGKSRIIKYFNQKRSVKNIICGDYDIFHPTYYDTYFLNYIIDRPFVVTIHDMIHEKFTNDFVEFKIDNKLIYNNKKTLLEKSKKIIAVSETTKHDIIEIFGIEDNKIDVIYHGNSLIPSENDSVIFGPYILFVGNRGLYKNFSFFITTIFHYLLKNNLKLICAGGGDFSLNELKLISSLGISNNIIYKKVSSDEILANYYKHALFFCFPSLYEGFGIPVLESFACGCPVLLSNAGSLTEIGGDSALYFNPKDKHSLDFAFNKILFDEDLRTKLKTKGYSRLKDFSWDKTYQDHLKLYESAL
jgi:glycosyltransferase involved in cell wall biosynthesis